MTLGCKGLIAKRVCDGAYFYIIDYHAWRSSVEQILLIASCPTLNSRVTTREYGAIQVTTLKELFPIVWHEWRRSYLNLPCEKVSESSEA